MKNIIKKFGFTLAEVLITVGIIGTIAAMTIPTLKDAYEEHVFESRAKATYNQLQQAVALSKYAGDRFIPRVLNREEAKKFYDKYFKNTLKVTKFCIDIVQDPTGCWGERRKDNVQNNYSVYIIPNMKGEGTRVVSTHPGVSFRMDSGAEVRIAISDENLVLPNQLGFRVIDEYGDEDIFLYVLFDTNGGANEPNAMGYDIYVLAWNGVELVPAGSSVPSGNIAKNCSLDPPNYGYYSGAFCLQYMIDNGWKINKDLF